MSKSRRTSNPDLLTHAKELFTVARFNKQVMLVPSSEIDVRNKKLLWILPNATLEQIKAIMQRVNGVDAVLFIGEINVELLGQLLQMPTIYPINVIEFFGFETISKNLENSDAIKTLLSTYLNANISNQINFIACAETDTVSKVLDGLTINFTPKPLAAQVRERAVDLNAISPEVSEDDIELGSESESNAESEEDDVEDENQEATFANMLLSANESVSEEEAQNENVSQILAAIYYRKYLRYKAELLGIRRLEDKTVELQELISNKMAEVDDLSRKLSEAEDKIEALEVQTITDQVSIKDAEAKTTEQKENIDKLERNYQEAKQECDQLKEELRQLSIQLKEAKLQESNLQHKVAELSAHKDAFKQSAERLEKIRVVNRDEISQLQAELKNEQIESAKRVQCTKSQLEERIRIATDESIQLRSELSGVKEKCQHGQQKYDDLLYETERLNIENQSLESQLTELAADYEFLYNMVTPELRWKEEAMKLRDTIQNLRSDSKVVSGQYRKELELKQTTIQEKDKIIEDLQRQLAIAKRNKLVETNSQRDVNHYQVNTLVVNNHLDSTGAHYHPHTHNSLQTVRRLKVAVPIEKLPDQYGLNRDTDPSVRRFQKHEAKSCEVLHRVQQGEKRHYYTESDSYYQHPNRSDHQYHYPAHKRSRYSPNVWYKPNVFDDERNRHADETQQRDDYYRGIKSGRRRDNY